MSYYPKYLPFGSPHTLDATRIPTSTHTAYMHMLHMVPTSLCLQMAMLAAASATRTFICCQHPPADAGGAFDLT